MGVKVDPSMGSYTQVKTGFWGVMVLFGSFLCRILQDGYLFALAIFIVKWQEHFSAGAAEVGLVGSITTAFMLMICPMGSAISRYYGCRPTVIGGGITAAMGLAAASQVTALWHLYTCMALVGIGMGICLVPSMVIIQYYFDKQLARVNGIAMSGVGVGMFTLSPLLHLLCEHFGWKGALLISASIISNLCLCGALFRPSELEREYQSRRKDSKEVKADVDGYEFTQEIPRTNTAAISDLLQCDLICNNGPLAFFLVVSLLFGFGYYSAFLFLVAHAIDIGITEMTASFLLSIAGLCSLTGRLSHGFLIDLGFLSAANLYTISICMCGFCCLVYPLSNYYVTLAIFTAIFGFFSGIMNSLVPIVPKELVDNNRVSGAVGLVCFMEGVGTLLGVYIM
ncbi:monocarboxylate transporter 12-like, partial [Amphiura filiformis]|uniref:monocarboxylate transporter 12-like n=1 Tax=Amphiura filiformis TaxID=82378 RepID=UPI003B218EA8